MHGCSLEHYISAKRLEFGRNQMSAQTRVTFDRMLQRILSFSMKQHQGDYILDYR